VRPGSKAGRFRASKRGRLCRYRQLRVLDFASGGPPKADIKTALRYIKDERG